MLRRKCSSTARRTARTLPSAKFASKLANHGSAVARADWRATPLWNILESCEIGRFCGDRQMHRRFRENSRKSAAMRQFAVTFAAVHALDRSGLNRVANGRSSDRMAFVESRDYALATKQDCSNLNANSRCNFRCATQYGGR